MLTINYKQIYETIENKTKEWILIIYDISANHYVGIPVYSKNSENTIYLLITIGNRLLIEKDYEEAEKYYKEALSFGKKCHNLLNF